jgi:ABC-type transport system substrate-binding protein
MTQLSSRRFELAKQTADRVTYRRLISEPNDSYEFHVAEVVERLYPTYEKAVQGLLRGEVSMLPRVHSRDVPQLRDDDRFEVIETALPVTHLIQFNPRSRVTRNRELRRAMIFALNRRKILQETVLDDPDRARGRLVSGPFPTQGLSFNNRRVRGYAYNTKVAPRRYDPSLAAALSLAASKHFGGNLPELRLLCVPDPVAIQAARQLVRHWGATGIRVKLLTTDDETYNADSTEWDIVYRIVRMTEPAVQLWPLLTLEPTARVESLAFLPDWLRQELIELDRVGDWKSAVSLLNDLHAHMAAEAVLIPLWELDDFVVYRNTIRGYPTPPLHPYQHIEHWTVKPWLPNNTP